MAATRAGTSSTPPWEPGSSSGPSSRRLVRFREERAAPPPAHKLLTFHEEHAAGPPPHPAAASPPAPARTASVRPTRREVVREFEPVYFVSDLPEVPVPPRVAYRPVRPLLEFSEVTRRRTKKARNAKRPARKVRVLAVRKKKAKKRAPKSYKDYKGDELFVIEVEGIGPTYAKRLIAAGVPTTTRLAYEKPAQLAKRIKAPEASVRSWHDMSQLIKVNDIGPQFSEILSRAGIRGIEALKRTPAVKIEKKLNRFLDGLDATVIGRRPSLKRIQGWKRRAAGMKKVTQPIPSKVMPKVLPWYAKIRLKKAAAKGHGKAPKARKGRSK